MGVNASRERLLAAFLWIAVLAWSTWVGGTLYQMLVVVPMWSASLPESLREFMLGTSYTTHIFNFFGPPFMVARLLPVLVALGLAWHLRRERALLGFASACLIATVIFTLTFVYPINDALFFRAGGDLGADEISRLATTWIWADRARFAIGVAALIAILFAFRQHRSSA